MGGVGAAAAGAAVVAGVEGMAWRFVCLSVLFCSFCALTVALAVAVGMGFVWGGLKESEREKGRNELSTSSSGSEEGSRSLVVARLAVVVVAGA